MWTLYQGIHAHSSAESTESALDAKEKAEKNEEVSSRFGSLIGSMTTSFKTEKAVHPSRTNGVEVTATEQAEPKERKAKSEGETERESVDSWKSFTQKLMNCDETEFKDEPGDNVLADLFGEQHANSPNATPSRADKLLDTIPDLIDKLMNDKENNVNKWPQN